MRRVRLWGRCLLALLLLAVLRGLRATWRVRVEGSPPGRGRATLLAFWHGDQLALLGAVRALDVAVLVSRSDDGDLAARVLMRLGLGVIRGSSSRGAVAAGLTIVRRLRSGQSVAVAADGPRGPRQLAGDSLRRLASRAGVSLVPVVARAGRCWRLRSWDRLCVPLPFSTVRIVWGEPLASKVGPGLRGVWAMAAR